MGREDPSGFSDVQRGGAGCPQPNVVLAQSYLLQERGETEQTGDAAAWQGGAAGPSSLALLLH